VLLEADLFCRYERPYLSPGAAQVTLLLLHLILPACVATEAPRGNAKDDATEFEAASVEPSPLWLAAKAHMPEMLPLLATLASSAVSKMLAAMSEAGGEQTEVCSKSDCIQMMSIRCRIRGSPFAENPCIVLLMYVAQTAAITHSTQVAQ
jgi:hypothetical protein